MSQKLWESLIEKIDGTKLKEIVTLYSKNDYPLDEIIGNPSTYSTNLFDMGFKTVSLLLYEGKLPTKKAERNKKLIEIYQTTDLDQNEDQIKQDICDVGLNMYKSIYEYKNKKRIIIRGTGVALILAGLGYAGVNLFLTDSEDSKKREVSFEDAKKNYSLRQKFIDDIVESYPPPIEGLEVKYNGDSEYGESPFHGNGAAFVTNVYFPAFSGPQIRNIVAFKSSFTYSKSRAEFVSSLVDHEYTHVKILARNLGFPILQGTVSEFSKRVVDINGDLSKIFHELVAYTNQIRTFSKRNVSNTYMRENIYEYNLYRNLLEAKESTPLIKYLLDYFPKI